MAINRIALLLCMVLVGGCAHVVVPHALEPSAETQSTGNNPIIVAVPSPSHDSEVVIHRRGQSIRTSNLWLGGLLAVLALLAQ